LLLFVGLTLRGATLIYTDFDNTIVETRKQFEGTFRTPFVLFRIDDRNSVLERVPDGPEVIEVTPVDYENMRRYLFHKDGDIENRNRVTTLEDGRKVRPGEYTLVFPDSYKYFFDGPNGENWLLKNYRETVKRDSSAKWQGPFWNQFVQIMGEDDTSRAVRVITARRHTSEHWDELFAAWVKEKHLPRAPITKYFHNVSYEAYDQFSLSRDIADRKALLVHQAINNLGRVPLTTNDMRLNPDGTRSELLHYVVFVDDSQETMNRILPLLQDVARTKRIPVKIGVFFMGLPTTVKESGRPQFSIIKSDGTFRAASPHEIVGDPLSARASLVQTAPMNPVACPYEILTQGPIAVMAEDNR
jgi:hypothetical protein